MAVVMNPVVINPSVPRCDKYKTAATELVDYVLGQNPTDYCC
jgi:hypothetical protein